MGKKSLLAPTSKTKPGSGESDVTKKKAAVSSGSVKKAAPRKAKKNVTGGADTKKKAAVSKTKEKKAAAPKVSPKKKTPTKKSATAKSSAKPKSKKTTASVKKTLSIKELLARKFEMKAVGKKYIPPSKPQAGKNITSPPYFVGETPQETERVRKLLFKKFAPVSFKSEEKSGAATKPGPKPADPKTIMAQPGAGTPGFGKPETEKPSAPFSFDETDIPIYREKSMDPLQKAVVFGCIALAVLIVMVMWSSALNVGKYYVKPVDGQLEIWKGRFSPQGVEKIFTISAASAPDQLKAVYSKTEAYGIIFDGIVNSADATLSTEEIPDFDLIRRTLISAEPYAVSKEMSNLLQRRLDKIDMMALVYKADILAGKGTESDLANARKSLEKALKLNLDEAEEGLIRQKIAWVDQKLSELSN